ncbi:hypothetical protein QJS10_CPB21g00180 [Acorus calamus]|uniref:Uncharacterized protein n=1 Tax=Acorus calamus TaxID=4465 RepID=A0AAV9C660_ACOCL|nr:hypothetical protein QJS10_CPB21g00180 [Acorus calamus]
MESSPPPSKLGREGLIDRTEFVRVIVQSLQSLGYAGAASLLESESGVLYQSPELETLRSQILDGRWDDSVATVGSMGLPPPALAAASFVALRELFMERLGSGDDRSALEVLRRRIAPLEVERSRIRELALAVVDRGRRLEVDRRLEVLAEMEGLLSPEIRVPERRLERLVEAAVEFQRVSCVYHNVPGPTSLYVDHCCGPDSIPCETKQILNKHENEVWFVQFSNNGAYLASSSRDCTAIIWMLEDNGTMSMKHTLRGHQKPVSFVAWSPDDTMLLTCGNGEVVKLWDVETGMCKHTFCEAGSPIVTSCSWFPDSQKFMCGSCDPENCIYKWDLQGNQLEAWRGDRMPKVSDLSITPDGNCLISICSETEIRIFNFKTRTERVISEEHPIRSLALSGDGQSFIVNLTNQEIHLWDVSGNWKEPSRYKGHMQEKYVIRSCFGGLDCMFIASGSENSQFVAFNNSTKEMASDLPRLTNNDRSSRDLRKQRPKN